MDTKKLKNILARVIVSEVFLGVVLAEFTMWNEKNPLMALLFFGLSLGITIGIVGQGLTKRNIAGMVVFLILELIFGLIPEGIVSGLFFLVYFSITFVVVLWLVKGVELATFAFSLMIVLVIWEVNFERRSSERKPSQTVVLEYVDVKSDDSIYIYVKDKGIFEVSSEAAKDWDYHAGDTVKVVIYDDKIISCEK